MAVKKEDYWVIVAGMGAIGAAYWYWTKRNTASGTATNASQDATTATADQGAMTYYPSMEGASQNIVTASQIYSQAGSGYVQPAGQTVLSQGQTYALPMNA